MVIWSCGARCHQYADDAQLYLSFSPTAVDAVSSLEHCLGTVLEWMRANGLRLNQDKTEMLCVGSPGISGLGNSLSFGGVTLPTKSEVPSLGICLDPDLTMETQVASVVRAAYFHLWRIAQLHPYLDAGALTMLIHALVMPLKCSLCGATLEADAEASTGPKLGIQVNNWGEEIPAHLPHSDRPSLATSSFLHPLQVYDDTIQSPKQFRSSVPIRTTAPSQICP